MKLEAEKQETQKRQQIEQAKLKTLETQRQALKVICGLMPKKGKRRINHYNKK